MKKILYIEDELFLGKIVKESLESKGYNVLMETDGAKAYGKYISFMPDICVLDIMLPNKNGYDIAEQIRKENNTTPIIFLTAKTLTADVVEGFKVGGNDYIRKPFSVEELIVRIENLTRNITTSISKEKNSILQIGKHCLYETKQLLEGFGEQKKLSFRETALLKYLIQNKQQVISRNDILKNIWGSDSLFNSRNLDVYITKLRAYLKEDDTIEILTLKGIGYRLIDNSD